MAHVVHRFAPILITGLLLAVSAPVAADAEKPKDDTIRSNLLPNGRRVGDLLVGGPPSLEQLEAIAKAGFKALIDLRAPEEPNTDGARERTTATKLQFFSLPVKGPKGITVSNAKALGTLLTPKDRNPTVVHCASGQRASTLIGLKAFVVDGTSKDEAIQLAKSLGMTRLEQVLRDRIAEHCKKNPAPNCK